MRQGVNPGMPIERTDVQDASEFYSKLFRALELGKKKAEKQVIAHLFERFGFSNQHEDSVNWFAENCSPEDVMGWLMREIEPFARMLGELYEWLSEIRSTVGGNIEEVSFDFARLGEQVSFSLESFPKTYLRTRADQNMLARGFNPGARGRLRVDTPNYWRDDVPALYNLSYQQVLDPYGFDKLPRPNKQAIASRVRHVVEIVEREYIRKTKPREIDHWQFGNYPILYVSSEAQWQEAIQLARRPGSDGGTAGNPSARDLYDFFDRGTKSGEMVQGRNFSEFLQHIETLRY